MQNLKITPNCPEQEGFLQTKAPYSAAIAGIGGGKTWAGAIRSLLTVVENPGIRLLVTAPTYKVLNDATIPCYEYVFGQVSPGFARFLRGDTPAARIPSHNAEIIFRSTEKPENLRGTQIGGCHMDEAALSPYASFLIIDGRLRQARTDGTFFPRQLWITTTPKGMNWIYLEFIAQQRDGYKVFSWGTKENLSHLPPDYLEKLKVTYAGNEKYMAQELEGKFHNLEGECAFNTQNLDTILKSICREPSRVEEGGYVKVWKEPVFGIRYVGGADVADMGGGGMSCGVILDKDSGEEQLEIHGDMGTDTFARLLNDWGGKYNDTFWGVECNGTAGGSVIKSLRHSGYSKLYSRSRNKEGEPNYGWYTSGVNRNVMISDYVVAVNRNRTRIYNYEAIYEMRTFINKAASPSPEHMSGCFDDRVMARAIAYRMTQEGAGWDNVWRTFKRTAGTYH